MMVRTGGRCDALSKTFSFRRKTEFITETIVPNFHLLFAIKLFVTCQKELQNVLLIPKKIFV